MAYQFNKSSGFFKIFPLTITLFLNPHHVVLAQEGNCKDLGLMFCINYKAAGYKTLFFTLPVTASETAAEAPVITNCPTNQQLFVGANSCSSSLSYNPEITGIPSPSISYVFSGATTTSGLGTGSGFVFNKGLTTVTITATNASGNTVCTFAVSVLDNIPPIVVSPAAITLSAGSSILPAITGMATATDNCTASSNIVIDYRDDKVITTCSGTITRTWHATDASNNVGTATQIITISDKVAPAVVTPTNQVLDLDGNCTATLPDYSNLLVVSDNCTPTHLLMIAQSPVAGTLVSAKGAMIVTFTVTDASGNATVGTISVNKKDVTPPTIVSQSSIVVSNSAKSCGAIVDYTKPISTDNCSGTAFNYFNYSEPNNSGGSEDHLQLYNSGTWNDRNCSDTMKSIMEINLPNMPTPNGYLSIGTFGGHTYCISNGDNQTWYAARASAIAAGGDLASINTMGEDQFLAPYGGTVWVGGYQDRSDPGYVEPGNAAQNFGGWKWVDGTKLGAGQIAMVQTGGLASGATYPFGTTTNTWTATDESGNVATSSFTVTVTDTIAPVIIAPAAIYLNFGSSIEPNVTGMATATDNCTASPNVTYTDDQALTTCSKTIVRTWQAKDASNNISTATQVIALIPAALATMLAPGPITVSCGGLPAASTISFSNGLNNVFLIKGISNPSTFTAAPAACGGTVIETWTATDPCGKTIAAVSRIITVTPAAVPIMSAPDPITVTCGGLPAASSIGFSNGLIDGYLIKGNSNPSTFTAAPAACGGTVTETWTATDPYGRTITSVSRMITVTPAALPTMTALPAITVACGGLPAASTISFGNGLSDGFLIKGISDPSTFTAAPAACGGTVIESWTATDRCGRAITLVSRTITVTPATLPTMVAPEAVAISASCGAAPAPSTLPFTNNLSDGCLISGTSNPSTFVTTPETSEGKLTETWTATDICGRTIASVSRTVTISQNLGMVQNCILFSGAGAVSNTGTSIITGDIGANVGAISGFTAPTTVNGSIYVPAIGKAMQVKIDLLNLYLHLSNIPITNSLHAAAFGNGETVSKGIYHILGAGSLIGNLILDAKGDSNAVIIFRFNGTFSPAAGSSVTLTNGMRACNVFFIAESTISIGATSVMKGTFIGHTGTVTMAAGGNLEGRLLATEGAVTFGSGTATLPIGLPNIPIIFVNSYNNPIMGSLTNFSLFTSSGTISNTGSSGIIGNIGSDEGAITNFETPATTMVGTIYSANSVTLQAKIDLQAAYVQLAGKAATNSIHGAAFGSGEILTAGVYTVATKGSLAGTLTLDAQYNPDAVFIFRFGGAFVTDAQSKVILINGARHCNIFWVAEGAISMGTFSFMKGTVIAHNGANTMGAYGNLEGSMFSTEGAIGFNTGVAYINYSLCGNSVPQPPVTDASTIALSAVITSTMALPKDKLSIYPNPNQGVLHLDYSGDVSKVQSIDICDMVGERIFYVDHYQQLIILKNKASGIYFVRIHIGKKVIAYKIMVNE